MFDKRWIGSNNMKDGRTSGICVLCGKCVEDQEHVMLRCDDRRMVARRSELMADIHTHVGRVIHRGGPGASALETIADIARDHAVYTGLFTPDIVSTLRQSREWTRASDGRSFAGLIKGMAPFVALLSGMMMKRDECTADDKAGTGQHYADGWGQRRGMQHKKTVGAVNIMCMARRAARRMASGTVATVEYSRTYAALEGAAGSTTPSARKAKKWRRRKKVNVGCADEQGQRQCEDIYAVDSDSSFKDVYADKAIHECNEHMNSSQAELGTLYTVTPEDIAMEKTMSEEWELLDSMYIRNFLEAERAVASGVPQAPAARSGVG